MKSLFKLTEFPIRKEHHLSSLNLKAHLRMIVNGFKCTKCKPDGSTRFQTLAEYHGHMIGTHKLQHVCHHCPFTSISRRDIRRHAAVHTKTAIREKYQCDICPSDPGTWFRGSVSLSNHRNKYH